MKLLGIGRVKGIKDKTGLRMTGRTLFGDMKECEREFSLEEVELGQCTEVYASALGEQDKGTKTEDLAPGFLALSYLGKSRGRICGGPGFDGKSDRYGGHKLFI